MRVSRPWARLGVLMLACWVIPAAWACTDPNQPLASPVDGVRLKLLRKKLAPSYFPEQISRVDVDRHGAKVTWTSDVEGFTPLGGSVRYEEPDGRGGWRICREEMWKSRALDSVRGSDSNPIYEPREFSSPGKREPMPVRYQGAPLQERNPILAHMTREFFVRQVVSYRYDAKGRLIEERFHDSDEVYNNPLNTMTRKSPLNFPVHCIRYHGDTAQVAWHADRIRDVLSCDEVTRTNAYRTEYAVLPDGRELEVSTSPTPPIKTDTAVPEHPDDKRRKRMDGPWRGYGEIRLPKEMKDRLPGESVSFGFNSHGLISVRTQNPNFTRADRSGLFTDAVMNTESFDLLYEFPFETVPLQVGLDGLKDIDQYRRVRVTNNTRLAPYIAEEFPAGSHHPVRRIWSNPSGIYREESFDVAGRPVRVINKGFFGQDVGYKENLRAYAESGVLKVTPAEIFDYGFRVYEYDAKGKEQLVLVCWEFDRETQKPYIPFPWWNGEKPRQFSDRMERINYYRYKVSKRCGPPDGSTVVVESDGMKQYMRDKYGYGTMKYSYYQRDGEEGAGAK